MSATPAPTWRKPVPWFERPRVVAAGSIKRGVLKVTTSLPTTSDVAEPYRGPIDLWEALGALAERALTATDVDAWGGIVQMSTESPVDRPRLIALAAMLGRAGLATELDDTDEDGLCLTVYTAGHGDVRTPDSVLITVAALTPTTVDWAAVMLEADRG